MDKGLLLAALLAFIAWGLVLSGLFLIANAFVSINYTGTISRRLTGVVKVVGSFSVMAALLLLWFRLTKGLVLRFKRSLRLVG